MLINEDYQSWNAELQVNDPESVRSFWQKAIQIRKTHQVMVSKRTYQVRKANISYGDLWRFHFALT